MGIWYGVRPAARSSSHTSAMRSSERVVLQRPGPHEVGRQHVVEHDVAARLFGSSLDITTVALQAQPVGGRDGHAHVIALPPATGHQRVGALRDRVGAQVVELARLVAAAGESGAVVALHEEPARPETERGGQAGRPASNGVGRWASDSGVITNVTLRSNADAYVS